MKKVSRGLTRMTRINSKREEINKEMGSATTALPIFCLSLLFALIRVIRVDPRLVHLPVCDSIAPA